jgi:hypothetical protein
VQKIKPRVEQVCQELGLQYATEENAGRMYINLQGGPATLPASGQQHGGSGYNNQPHQGGQQQQGGYHQGGQQQQGHGQNQGGNQQNNQNNDELEKLALKLLPKILKKLDGCCTVM